MNIFSVVMHRMFSVNKMLERMFWVNEKEEAKYNSYYCFIVY